MRKLLVLLAAVAFVVAFTVPAVAADWAWYGHARMLTFQTDLSKEKSGLGVDDSDLGWDKSTSGRFGAKAKAGAVTGQFEAKMSDDTGLRLLYGSWNFGAGRLNVGQQYGPVNFFPSNMVYGDNSMVSYGAPYGGRVPQIELGIAGFQIALLKPNVKSAVGATPTETDTTLPKIELSYNLKLGFGSLYFFAGMNTHDDNTIVGTAETEKSVDSNVFGVGFRVPLGALYVNGNVYMSTNPGNYGLATTSAVSSAELNAAGSVQDVDSMTYALIVGYKISDMLRVEAGYGFVDGEITVDAVTCSNEKTFYYAQLPITLAKNVYITPEIGKADFGDKKETGLPDAKLGDLSYFGAKWEIRF